MVSDLNHLPGRLKRSDLVQSERGTSPDVVGGLTRAQELYTTVISLWERPENTHLGLIWAHLGSFGPLEASRGQTKQTKVGIKVVYGILEQVGSVQRARK